MESKVMKNIVKILDNVRNVNDFDEVDEITLIRQIYISD
jgi:hypothetical protein